eukprot:COSAG02_NODE_1221_length_13805_cov_24.976653_7_plen_311_part_01
MLALLVVLVACSPPQRVVGQEGELAEIAGRRGAERQLQEAERYRPFANARCVDRDDICGADQPPCRDARSEDDCKAACTVDDSCVSASISPSGGCHLSRTCGAGGDGSGSWTEQIGEGYGWTTFVKARSPGYTGDYTLTYQGCYADPTNSCRDMQYDEDSRSNGPHERLSFENPEQVKADCAALCSGFHYMGLQWSTQCWCANHYGSQGASDACGENEGELCGNGQNNCASANAVWDLLGGWMWPPPRHAQVSLYTPFANARCSDRDDICGADQPPCRDARSEDDCTAACRVDDSCVSASISPDGGCHLSQ